jgi:hypothetical protein
MLFKIGLVLVSLWLVAMVGAYNVGVLVHVLLLSGLMFVLIGWLRARDAAARRAVSGGSPNRP